ncbi:hypothetical protein [Stackebrandtia albiflava]|uniref:hypothetical protein n=1 Tax=Stackebrandtia albiflava TaxID=406432 RepID=UPI0011BED8C1|nr:hypothetical protein [Stackebrandtia albiflava]
MTQTTIGPRLDLLLALMMALAAVGTAWAGFQSAKWSRVQANTYAAAGAARSEAGRVATVAAQQRTIDVVTFTSWLNALNAEIVAGDIETPRGGYTPDPESVSGFLFTRFGEEFRPAVDAWLETRPLIDPRAPATPFDMPEYRLAAEQAAAERVGDADELAGVARTANQRSDNYVLTAVVFALVLLFAGLAGKTPHSLARRVLTVVGAVALAGCLVTLLVFPVEL